MTATPAWERAMDEIRAERKRPLAAWEAKLVRAAIDEATYVIAEHELRAVSRSILAIPGLSRYMMGPRLDHNGIPIPDGIQSGYAINTLIQSARARQGRMSSVCHPLDRHDRIVSQEVNHGRTHPPTRLPRNRPRTSAYPPRGTTGEGGHSF